MDNFSEPQNLKHTHNSSLKFDNSVSINFIRNQTEILLHQK
jgi:hypothetical protein